MGCGLSCFCCPVTIFPTYCGEEKRYGVIFFGLLFLHLHLVQVTFAYAASGGAKYSLRVFVPYPVTLALIWTKSPVISAARMLFLLRSPW